MLEPVSALHDLIDLDRATRTNSAWGKWLEAIHHKRIDVGMGIKKWSSYRVLISPSAPITGLCSSVDAPQEQPYNPVIYTCWPYMSSTGLHET